MMMSVVDSMMVGRVSKEAMGAVSLGGVLFYAVAVFGMGMMLGLDALVSQAFGAGDRTDCHHSLVNALWIALPLAPALMAAQWAWIPLLPVVVSVWLLRGVFSTDRIFYLRDLTNYTWPLTRWLRSVSYTHLRAHETISSPYLVD